MLALLVIFILSALLIFCANFQGHEHRWSTNIPAFSFHLSIVIGMFTAFGCLDHQIGKDRLVLPVCWHATLNMTYKRIKHSIKGVTGV